MRFNIRLKDLSCFFFTFCSLFMSVEGTALWVIFYITIFYFVGAVGFEPTPED
jgi:hypothetical protein